MDSTAGESHLDLDFLAEWFPPYLAAWDRHDSVTVSACAAKTSYGAIRPHPRPCMGAARFDNSFTTPFGQSPISEEREYAGARRPGTAIRFVLDWTSSEAPSANIPLEGISGPSIYKCYAAGQDSNFDAQITRTANGGSSWVKQTLPSATFASGDSSLSSIDCPSKLDCYAVGWQVYASRATTCPTF
jgi:hypothetical protein